MRDPAQPPERRDKAAALLLPFMHPRIAGQTLGKKEQERTAAIEAARRMHERFGTPLPIPSPWQTPDEDDEWGEIVDPKPQS